MCNNESINVSNAQCALQRLVQNIKDAHQDTCSRCIYIYDSRYVTTLQHNTTKVDGIEIDRYYHFSYLANLMGKHNILKIILS